ncbi:UNVERIFIED_CONTAM: hypothetical protein FKN15_013762 [Acipenser sinensis]
MTAGALWGCHGTVILGQVRLHTAKVILFILSPTQPHHKTVHFSLPEPSLPLPLPLPELSNPAQIIKFLVLADRKETICGMTSVNYPGTQ